MKQFRIFTLAAMIMLLFLSGCGEEESPPSQTQDANVQQQNVRQQADNTRSQSAKTDIWPFVEKAPMETDVAENLTAKNYMLVFDGSGSMNGSKCAGNRLKIEVARDAVAEWAKTIPQDAHLGLVAFHNGGWSTLPLAPADQSETFVRTTQELLAGGGTPLPEAFKHAYEHLTEQGRKQLGYGEYTIVVVTDGIANSETALAKWVNYILSVSPINIYTIGFCIGEEHSLNQTGRTVYKAANNPEELRQGLQEVLAESETFDESEFGQ